MKMKIIAIENFFISQENYVIDRELMNNLGQVIDVFLKGDKNKNICFTLLLTEHVNSEILTSYILNGGKEEDMVKALRDAANRIEKKRITES